MYQLILLLTWNEKNYPANLPAGRQRRRDAKEIYSPVSPFAFKTYKGI